MLWARLCALAFLVTVYAANPVPKDGESKLLKDEYIEGLSTARVSERFTKGLQEHAVTLAISRGAGDVRTVDFFPKVDEFTQLKLAESFGWTCYDGNQTAACASDVPKGNDPETPEAGTERLFESVVLRAGAGGKWSRPIYWQLPKVGDEVSSSLPSTTVLILIREGEVQEIGFDETYDAVAEECILCEKADCKKVSLEDDDRDPIYQCTQRNDLCLADAAGDEGKDCDLKVYVAWVGTDSNSDQCISRGSTFSRFRDLSASTYGKLVDEQVGNEVASGVAEITDATNSVEGWAKTAYADAEQQLQDTTDAVGL